MLKDTIRRSREFLTTDLWSKEPPPGWRGAPFWFLRTVFLVGEGFWKQDLLVRAAALTYKVIFAIVPFFAVILAFLKGFIAFERYEPKVRKWVVDNVAPGVADQVMDAINDMIKNTDARAIGFVGFALLIYTAISLLTTVESSFNVIWNVRRPRGFVRRLTIFWTLLTLGPICIAGSIAVSGFVQNQRIYDWLTNNIPLVSIMLTAIVPWILTWIVFGAMYLIMPNTTVSFRAAALGAIVAGSIWEILKRLYIAYNANILASYEVYGPLSAIPVLLLWVYISWVIVLFGAELVFAMQHVRTYEREKEAPNVSQSFKERLALYTMLEITRAFLQGKEAPGGETLAEKMKAPVRAVNDVIFTLVGQKILREIPNGQQAGYIPAEDPERFTVKRVIDAMRTHGLEPPLQDGAPRLVSILQEAEASSTRTLDSVTMRQLASEPPPA